MRSLYYSSEICTYLSKKAASKSPFIHIFTSLTDGELGGEHMRAQSVLSYLMWRYGVTVMQSLGRRIYITCEYSAEVWSDGYAIPG